MFWHRLICDESLILISRRFVNYISIFAGCDYAFREYWYLCKLHQIARETCMYFKGSMLLRISDTHNKSWILIREEICLFLNWKERLGLRANRIASYLSKLILVYFYWLFMDEIKVPTSDGSAHIFEDTNVFKQRLLEREETFTGTIFDREDVAM